MMVETRSWRCLSRMGLTVCFIHLERRTDAAAARDPTAASAQTRLPLAEVGANATGETHVPDLLPPGSHLVQGLSPGSATADTRGNLGMVALPLGRATSVVWKRIDACSFNDEGEA